MLTERIAVAVAAITLAAPITPADTDWIEPSPILKGLYNIDWEGGTLGEFLAGIDERTDASFVVPGVASKIKVEPFTLDGIWPQESLDVLTSLLPGFSYTPMGGHVTVWQDDGTVKELERPWNYVISISNELGDRAKQQANRFDLRFEGGPVSAFLRAIQEVAGEKKIVVMPEASGEPVPPMDLTNVTIADAVGLLDNLANVGVDLVEGVAIVRPQRNLPGPSSIFESDPEIESAAWTVEHIVSDALTSEDLLSAIDAAIGLENGKTRIRYHLETGLLIARGPSMELALIGQVIDRARDTANRRVTAINLHKNEASDLRLHLRQLESEMETEKIERDLARDELRVAESHLADVQKLAEEEFVSNAQLAGTQLEIDKKRANIRKHELKIDTLLARISAARERLETLTGRE